MNRKIKVRAYDEDAETMFYSDKLEDDYFFAFDEKGILKGYAIRPPRLSDDPLEPTESHCDIYPTMDYTGLLDKNGKDLDWWEDDLFRITGFENIFQIVFRDGCFMFQSTTTPQHFCCSATIDWGDLPIKIGNIYKNKDLLNA
jgi:hypothetical protein